MNESTLIAILAPLIILILISSISYRRRRYYSDISAQLFVLEAKVDAILSHLKISFEYQPTDRARLLAKQGYVIEAIKVLRTANPSMGLKEAKDIVDTFKKSL